VARGIANAIANVSHQLFEGWSEPWGDKRFDSDVCDRSQLEVANEMLDWMIDYEATSEEVLETTLRRLKEVLAEATDAES
jgi:hypothetical protein